MTDTTMSEDIPTATPVREQRSLCRFCAGVCGVIVHTRGDQVIRVTGDKEHPISRGYLCPKGRALGHWHHHPDRLDYPLIRRSGDEQHRVSWNECLEDLSGRLSALITRYGPASV